MAGRLGRSKAVVVVVALALAACSGDDDEDASADASSRTTTTLAPEPTITTTVAAPPLYSFDGSVPAPALNITGDDFDAIYRSLDTYQSWLYSHNPDVELVDEIATFGSDVFNTITDDLREVVDEESRLYSDTISIESVEVADTADGIVTLRVSNTAGQLVLVDETGTTTDSSALDPIEQIVLLSRHPDGRWLLSSASNIEDDPVVIE